MQSPTSSFELVERLQRGDRHAASQLFDRYRGRLAVWIHFRLGSKLRESIEVDDVIQETLLEAFRDLDRFEYRSPGSFFRWLSRIAENVLLDAARFENRKKRYAVEIERFRSDSNPQGHEPINTQTPTRLLAEQEALTGLVKVLDELSEDYRQAILLVKVAGLTTAEMGERTGRSRQAAALLLHRALKRFREIHSKRPGK